MAKTMTLVEGHEEWNMKRLQGFLNGCTKRGVKPQSPITMEHDKLGHLVLSVAVPDDTPILRSAAEARAEKQAEESKNTNAPVSKYPSAQEGAKQRTKKRKVTKKAKPTANKQVDTAALEKTQATQLEFINA